MTVGDIVYLNIMIERCSSYFMIVLGGFEVNFMDDVGQTLLNWASAFGTLEMVLLLSFKIFENHNYLL